MSKEKQKRKLSAIFSADVKDYSRLMRDDEAETVKTLNSNLELIRSLTHQHYGRIVDSPGDNVLAEFASVVDAVQAAVAIQKELKSRNLKVTENRKMEYRIGINLGDIIVENDRIYGDGVNIAARLEGLADPGGICISRTAFDQIEDKLPLGYKYLGEKTVKNISKPIRAYKVLVEPYEHHNENKRKIHRITKNQATQSLPKWDASSDISIKKRVLTLVLCILFGVFGAHRFYVGKIGTGIMQIITIGGLGIWFLVDFIIILFGEFTDSEEKKIRSWF